MPSLRKLTFENAPDGGPHGIHKIRAFDENDAEIIPTPEVPNFDPNNPQATLGKIKHEGRIYVSQKNPNCVTIYFRGKAYQV